jgi:16S rRNA (cytosine1407-C5)-methyltransferase
MQLLGVSDTKDEPHPRPLLLGEGESDDDFSEEVFDLPSPGRGGRGWGLVQEPQTSQSTWNFRLRMEHGSKLCKEFPEYFDKILLDAPCSAEARFIIGQPKTLGYWSERKIKEMAYKQRQLILSAWNALKPGGVMVYSTCTLAPEENEMQVSRLLERNENAELVDIDLKELKRLNSLKEWKGKVFVPSIKKALRIMPTKEIEGFFIAKLRKKS